jgi:hypothetical protein
VRWGRARRRSDVDDVRDEIGALRLELRESMTHLRDGRAAHDAEIARGLRLVADACHLVAGRVEAERRERAALVETLERLVAHVAAAPPVRPRSSVLGGSIDPELLLEDTPAASPTGLVPHEAVEVHCRFGDRWVSGFEVAEVVRDGGGARYRLRRKSDDSVLPSLFDERDIRFRVAFVDR